MGVSLACLHTPHKTLLMRTELTQAKLKPLAKDMQTHNLSLVTRMPPCKNTHMHMYVHCLQFQAPTSFSVSTHVCALALSSMDLEVVLQQTKEAMFPSLLSRHKTICSGILQGFLKKNICRPQTHRVGSSTQSREKHFLRSGSSVSLRGREILYMIIARCSFASSRVFFMPSIRS